MVKKSKDRSSVVKINSNLLKEVEEFIKQEANKFKFVNKKQLIDIAVYDYLKKVRKLSK